MKKLLKSFNFNKEIRIRLKHTIIWIFATLFISLSASFLIYFIERSVNSKLDTIGEILWWWIVTITGLGYGDRYPITTDGKMIGAFVIFTGLVLLAIVVSEVAELLRITYERKEKGIIRITYSDHIVIYGYTSLTAGVIKLLKNHFGKDLKIVLISNDIDFNPFPSEVDFIYANPIDRDTFVEANASTALASIILANDRFSDPDAYSLVIATGVERFNPRSVTIVELMDQSYKDLYKEGNIEAFINRKELLKDLLAKSQNSKLVRIIEKETDLSGANSQDTEEIDLV